MNEICFKDIYTCPHCNEHHKVMIIARKGEEWWELVAVYMLPTGERRDLNQFTSDVKYNWEQKASQLYEQVYGKNNGNKV